MAAAIAAHSWGGNLCQGKDDQHDQASTPYRHTVKEGLAHVSRKCEPEALLNLEKKALCFGS